MIPSLLGNFCSQAKVGTALSGPLLNLSQYVTTCNPCKCLSTCVRYGEKTVFPFADDIAEVAITRCRSDSFEDKKLNCKNKVCKGGFGIRHAMIRSHYAANSAVSNLNKSTPLVLMTIADPNYKPIMEELCSEENYSDAEKAHRKMIADRLLNGLSSLQNFAVLKSKMNPVFLKHGKGFLKHSNKKTNSQVVNQQLLAYRISRTKRLIGKDFSSFSNKLNKLGVMHVKKSVKGTGKVTEKAQILCDSRTVSNQPFKSMLIHRVLKSSNNCTPNIN